MCVVISSSDPLERASFILDNTYHLGFAAEVRITFSKFKEEGL